MDRTMPRKKKPASSRGRFEFVAAPEWIDQVTRHAESLGTNTSAYIREAVNKQMARDRMEMGAPQPRKPKRD